VFKTKHFWPKFVGKNRSSYIFRYSGTPKRLRVPSLCPGRAASFAHQSAETEVTMRILVVEDEPKVARTLVKGLEVNHFAVDLAGNGEEGLQLATEVDYDLIVLDWNLPKLDGLTVLKKLRKSGSNIRVMLLSARTDVSDRVCGLRAGADDFLLKPFSFDELLARIHALLRRPQELLDKLNVADLELDRMRHTVTRAGKHITLTQREYGVLEYLMRNAGRTVTRTMIVEHVWNLGFEGLTNIVDVYINYLRAKIDHGFEKPLIHTSRGIGYVLAPPEHQMPLEQVSGLRSSMRTGTK
jgi:two-component system, OmpR family, copper resistance phosphate regulon response regulator CusR